MKSDTVTKRENTGVGFFTNIAISGDAPTVKTGRVLGYEIHAYIRGLEHGLGFVLFMSEGRMHQLEGYAYGSDSIASLNLFDLAFEIFGAPIQRIG